METGQKMSLTRTLALLEPSSGLCGGSWTPKRWSRPHQDSRWSLLASRVTSDLGLSLNSEPSPGEPSAPGWSSSKVFRGGSRTSSCLVLLQVSPC